MSYKAFNSVDVDNASIFEASNYKALLDDIIDIPRTPTVSSLVDPKEYHRQYFKINRDRILNKNKERYWGDEETRDIIAKRAQLRYLIDFFRKYYNDPNYDPRSDLQPRTGKLRGMSIKEVCKAAGCSYITVVRYYSYGWIPKETGNNRSIVYTEKHVKLLKTLFEAARKLKEPMRFKKTMILKPIIDDLHRNWN